jgi:ketosteroid isomerase-like protein
MSDVTELQKIFDRWTERFIAGDIDSCTSLFASNGTIYQPNFAAIEGYDAIRSAHRDWMDAGEINKKVTVVDGRISGNLAYCVARYSGNYPDDDGSMTTETGTVVSVLHRDPDGNWRWRLSALHSD